MRDRKHSWGKGLALVVAAALSFGAISSANAEQFVLKALNAWPKNTTEQKAFNIFLDTVAEMVAKQAPGELKIQFIGGPEAVKTPDQMQAVQRGMADMVFTANAFYVSIIPEVDALKLSDYTPWEERANGTWAFVNNLHEQKGLYYLGRLGLGGQFYLYLKKPIQHADLKGLNIRVSPMYLQLVKGLGGNPVVIPPTEVFAGLERGVVDGFCWPEVGIREWGWEKQVKYLVKPGFYEVPNPVVLNLASWNRLPQKLKDILTAAAIESEKKVVAFYGDLAKKELPILEKDGMKIIDLPAAEAQKFLRVASEEGWKSVIEKSPKTGPELKKLLVKSK